MKVPFSRYIIYLFFLLGGLSYYNTAKATEGCCKITQYNGVPRYITLDETQCNAEQAPWQGLYYTFDITKIASNDHEDNDCVPFGCCQWAYKNEVITKKECDGKNGIFYDLDDEEKKELRINQDCIPG